MHRSYKDTLYGASGDTELFEKRSNINDSEYWKEVARKYKAAFCEDTSKDSLKRLKLRATEKTDQMAE